ncbi:unnamed protein product [Arabidopsis halleri]
MDPEKVELPIHDHAMIPLKDVRVGDCCGIKFEDISDGYYCSDCDFFTHKRCSNSLKMIKNPSHKCGIFVRFETNFLPIVRCSLCGGKIVGRIQHYTCRCCEFKIHLDCARYPPPKVIDIPQNHDHKLELELMESCFTCNACGKDGDGYTYKCHECHLTFHVNCKKYAAEVNHPCHSLHPLKLLKGEPPAYTDGKCRLCGKNIDEGIFYHCSLCNFTIDLHCVYYPPPQYLHDLNTHIHKLALKPKSISFTCTACGLDGDRSPYVCLHCDFMSHNDCSRFPWVINVNRHSHRVSYTCLIGVVNSVCGVCRKKMDWSCGGYSCQRCPKDVYHTKCATRKDVWDGLELKDVPEEDEDVQPLKVIDENTIQHYKHKKHHLRLHKSCIFIQEIGICKACLYPIDRDSFYNCLSCDFILHERCAELPTRKCHMLSNTLYHLQQHESSNYSKCDACGVIFNGFVYRFEEYRATNPFEYRAIEIGRLDVRCASVVEPFFHQSHPNHPLYYTSPRGVCSACKKEAFHVLRCVEDDCGYILDFECALLPYEVKHRVDDHYLSLCYGENSNGKYWCDICERETDPKAWFYTCKYCGVTLHTNCVLGDFRGLRPGSSVSWYEVMRNNSMSRPLCKQCKSRCMFPITLRARDNFYCSVNCCEW